MTNQNTPVSAVEMHRGQLRFAERFTRAYGGCFLHAHGIGWHEYDGARWAECLDGAEKRAVVALIKDAIREASELAEEPRKTLLKDVARVEPASGVNGVLDLAQNMHPCTIAAKDLDADPVLLNTKTGTVNLQSGEVRPPRPADHLSKVTMAAFKPDAVSTVFHDFLEQTQPDPEMRAFLARSLGSALLGEVRDHVLHIWHGAGANGKGTLRDAVRHALGNYAVEVPAEILLQSKYGQQALAPERMRLKGARVAFCSEIAHGARLDEATMKKLTGGDPVNAKLLYRNPIEFDPSHTLFMLTNHLPQVRGDDPAVWRRILAIPFDVVIPPVQRDNTLKRKLQVDAEAVFAWLWRGWLDYQRNGLNPPSAVLAATEQYRLASDVLGRFLDERTIASQFATVKARELFTEWSTWCTRGGEQPGTEVAFAEAMNGRGYAKKKRNTGAAYLGLMLAAEDDEPEEVTGSDGWSRSA